MLSGKVITECHWEITKRCNLFCIHCVAATGSYKELDTEDSLKALDNLHALGCKELYITGGEPLIRTDIFSILQKAKEMGFKVGLLTNGTLINRMNIKKIKRFVDELGVSVEGSSKTVNDKIRGNGSFEKVIRAIVLIKKYAIPFSLYVTINGLNIDDLTNTLELAKKLGARSIRLNEITLRGRATKSKKRLGVSKDRRDFLNTSLYQNLIEYTGQSRDDIETNEGCDANPQTIFLSSSGLIYPCTEIYQQAPNNHLGGILDATSKFLRKHKKFHSENKYGSCPYLLLTGENIVVCLNNESIVCPFVQNMGAILCSS